MKIQNQHQWHSSNTYTIINDVTVFDPVDQQHELCHVSTHNANNLLQQCPWCLAIKTDDDDNDDECRFLQPSFFHVLIMLRAHTKVKVHEQKPK